MLEIDRRLSLGPWIWHGFQGPKSNDSHWEFMHFRADPSKPFINAMKIKHFEEVEIDAPEKAF